MPYEKKKKVCVCLSWKRSEGQRGEQKGRASRRKKTTFSNDLHWRISFRRQNKDLFPASKTIQISVEAYVLKARAKLKQEEPTENKKVWALNFSASASTHVFARKRWAWPLWSCCVFTTRPVTGAKLSMAFSQRFRNSPKGSRRNRGLGSWSLMFYCTAFISQNKSTLTQTDWTYRMSDVL